MGRYLLHVVFRVMPAADLPDRTRPLEFGVREALFVECCVSMCFSHQTYLTEPGHARFVSAGTYVLHGVFQGAARSESA